MAGKSRPNLTRKARIAPSVLDDMEAMVRYPGFKRSLALWQSIEAKQYRDLTEEEDRENNAPRTRFRIAAIMEAQDQWLSRSIKQIRNQDEAEWAFEAVSPPFGDDTATFTLPANFRIPLDLSLDAILEKVKQRVRQQQERSGVTPIQRPRRPEVDPWDVYDLKHEQGLSLAAITKQLFGVPACPVYGKGPGPEYRRVRAAYKFACKMIKSIGSDSR